MISLALSEKLLRLAGGEQFPASMLKHAIVEEMIKEGVIDVRISGSTRRTLYITDRPAFDTWLYNRYAIHNLSEYIRVLKDGAASRADLVQVSNDSKAGGRRSYKGFLVNSYMPVSCTLNGKPFAVHPQRGTFMFVYDFETFVPGADVVVVGIENMENFYRIHKQAHLFEGVTPLFVCRYPQEQGRDLMKWLLSIPNRYLHFGDYDLAGINIYLNEYSKHLNDRASFFIPDGIEDLLEKHGNRNLYDQQQLSSAVITDENLLALVSLIHKHKKGLEQEALLIGQPDNEG